MKTIEKTQVLMLSDGSILHSKTYFKTSNKIKVLNKDHKTILLNKKNKKNEHYLKGLDHFKLKFFKF
jgi:hypothetical protein